MNPGSLARRLPAARAAAAAVVVGVLAWAATGDADGHRIEIAHPGTGHDVHVSAPALAADGLGPVVAWITKVDEENVVYLVRPAGTRVRVNPPGLGAESLHQSPGLAIGPGDEIYVSWAAARRPRPAGALVVSDLYLSRSVDGGQTFESLRVTDDAPTSHSFEGLAVAPDGAVLLAWIETKAGGRPRTHLARLGERGSRVESVRALDDNETCVCCRIALATARPGRVAVFWRTVMPGDIRDMVLARSLDGARTTAAPARVHADDWTITACPHRGGSVAFDARGRTHAVWYTEGTRGEPDVLYAVAPDGARFGPPQRVHVARGTIPDHARLAVQPDGRAVIVWEDATAVRRRILVRETTPAGPLGPIVYCRQR